MATRHIGLIVTGCLIGGLVAALALVVGPVVPYTHDALVTDRTAAEASTRQFVTPCTQLGSRRL